MTESDFVTLFQVFFSVKMDNLADLCRLVLDARDGTRYEVNGNEIIGPAEA